MTFFGIGPFAIVVIGVLAAVFLAPDNVGRWVEALRSWWRNGG
jgi:hypothetical protein